MNHQVVSLEYLMKTQGEKIKVKMSHYQMEVWKIEREAGGGEDQESRR